MYINQTSQNTINYNCFAWAAGADRQDEWWEPSQDGFWPDGVQREENLESYIEAYRSIGYELSENSDFELGFEKIAIYVNDRGLPRHASRQLPNGNWTSKLGAGADVEHEFTDEFNCHFENSQIIYGRLSVVMKREEYVARPN